MAVTPAGSLSLAVDNVRNLLADCAAFRTWVGAADRAGALEAVFTPRATDPVGPFAVVLLPDELSFPQIASDGWGERLSVLVMLQAPVTHEDEYEAYLSFCNPVGQIKDQMGVLAAGGDHFVPTNVKFMQTPERLRERHHETESDFYWCLLVLEGR